MTRDRAGFPLGFLLLLVLAVTLAGCTGNGGGDVVTPADSTAGEKNPSAVDGVADHGETGGSDGGVAGVASEPGAEADTTNPGDSLGSTDEPADGSADTRGEGNSDAGTDTAAAMEDFKESLPFLIDLGATKCIPCKLMAPILDELAETKRDYFDVIFYDVWEDRSKAQEFGIRAIPTQIFYSARGEELFRHEGYYSRKQILDKWRELGVDVGE